MGHTEDIQDVSGIVRQETNSEEVGSEGESSFGCGLIMTYSVCDPKLLPGGNVFTSYMSVVYLLCLDSPQGARNAIK